VRIGVLKVVCWVCGFAVVEMGGARKVGVGVKVGVVVKIGAVPNIGVVVKLSVVADIGVVLTVEVIRVRDGEFMVSEGETDTVCVSVSRVALGRISSFSRLAVIRSVYCQ
jgi:hypothetical protein